MLLLASFYVQYLSARKKELWPSILLIGIIFIPSMVFLVMNYLDAFPTVEGFAGFLLDYGTNGVWALILKTGLILFPSLIHLGILIFVKLRIKRKKQQMDKMIATDI